MPELKKGVIVGAGFAGLAAAYWFREHNPRTRLIILEKEKELFSWLSRKNLEKVVAGFSSGSGEPLEGRYTRGLPEVGHLLEAWPGSSSLDWLESIGFSLRRTSGGTAYFEKRSELAQHWHDLMRKRDVEIRTGYALESFSRQADGSFRLWSNAGDALEAAGILMATGGERNHGMTLARELGHETTPPEAGFLRLRLANPKLGTVFGPMRRRAGLRCSKSGMACTEEVVLSGRGLEGPAVARLSAQLGTTWRQLRHRLTFEVDCLPDLSLGEVVRDIVDRIERGGRGLVGEEPLFAFTPKQWAYFLKQVRVDSGIRWGKVKHRQLQSLAQQLKRTRIAAAGAGLPANERAWSGGVRRADLHWANCRSTIVPNLWFSGEILDFLGMPGGPQVNAVWASGFQSGTDFGRWLSGET